MKSFGPLSLVISKAKLRYQSTKITYIVKTGPYISEDPWSFNGGEYGARKELLPRAGELCKEPCERRGDGVRLLAYSGRVLGIKSGEPF